MEELTPEPALLRRARRAYEWGRLRRAVLGALPLLLVIAPAAVLTPRLAPTLVVATTLTLGAVSLLWFGHGFPRAVLLGVGAGLLPLGLVLCSSRFGHACAGSWCMEFCFGTSAIGGAAAGALIGSWAFEKHVPGLLLATASAFGLLTGAMGSTCVGAAGAVALLAGFALGIAAQWVRAEVAS
ncbi:MAG: hypothetical protein JNM17_27730 [Archangium sp.]|nr:hypothetical protein [Archangium sp.]